MPAAVDTPYIIGVIRHHERTLLGDDEYTRLLGAATPVEAREVLTDTPYGSFVTTARDRESNGTVAGLQERLAEALRWLASVCPEPRVITFLQARYDGLNVASALLDYHAGAVELKHLSPLGGIPIDVLKSTVWHNQGWEAVSEGWRPVLRAQRQRTLVAGERMELVAAVEEATLDVMAEAAITAWMQRLVQVARDRAYMDRLLRFGRAHGPAQPVLAELTVNDSVEDMAAALEAAGYFGFTSAQLASVRDADGDAAYERQWDEQVVRDVRAQRSEPVGYDPIVAWWLALELEVRTIRALLAGRHLGHTPDELQPLIRETYRTFV